MSEEEEFEFRARAEAEEAQARKAAEQTPQTAQSAVPGQGPVAPSMLDQAGNFVTQTAVPVAFGVGKAGMDLAAANPGIAAAAGAAAFPKVASKIPGVGQALDLAKGVVDVAKNYNLNQMEHQAVQYMKAGQNPPPEFQRRLDMLRQASAPKPMPQTAPAQPAQQSMTNRIRQMAAQRIAGFGASGAAVPAGVAAGGAVATGIAGGQLAGLTPEQRRALYENEMLGAMGGDASLAAAIMNRGQ